ncbi:MAG: PTS-dependent dihydroxyacetone kinase phosphotransferase subunit DhaM, partial [Anaerolineales bacterium]|nr:PTS-dependent dihydroxyacetone kinase phosphotransferase subunit DhaM [Anaerolineales bacterium]
MVGIVIVSHSRQLAEGVLELARQMAQQPVPLAAAGGIDDPEHPIGTSAVKVFEAINAVYGDDGVLVLMDLGSALLSAETALELLDAAQRPHVRLCSAPLVEGALSAVVQASIGGTLAQVYAEAQGALATKRAQLAQDMGEAPVETAVSAGEQEIELPVRNRLGLHARPAARFVAAASQFAADVRLIKGARSANAKSINQVATLGVRQGDVVRVTAAGADAAAALAAIQALADANFGDRDGGEAAAPPAAGDA